ncbi:hypothetical protein LLH06_11000 [Mucilaginibacter daejeonensis]|uniref:hypothetical protein n=1 Tax=Mucilaginibacter daejeonensis TaxID=398049 RepID=UPI001D175769|nr:hypothetical protein [Mucilaginibacter daejeonensis]UEG51499.1 hypothetical protein LLH06_11000 [Mucilaginibacter daejeonensis]
MSMDNGSNDQYKYSEAIKKSRLTMPDMSFEEKVMMGVELEVERRQDRKYLIYAIACLMGFAISGVIIISTINVWWPLLSSSSSRMVGSVVRSVFVLAILISLDKILGLWKRYRTMSAGTLM